MKEPSMRIRSTSTSSPGPREGAQSPLLAMQSRLHLLLSPSGPSHTKSSNARRGPCPSHTRPLPWSLPSAWDTLLWIPTRLLLTSQDVFPASLCPCSPLPSTIHGAPAHLSSCTSTSAVFDLQGHQSLPCPGMSASWNLTPSVHCNFHNAWNSARFIVYAQLIFVD